MTPVSFEVGNGDCVTVAGPSGSGKTLLLRAVTDLDPAAGTVKVDGNERNGMTAPRWRGPRVLLLDEPTSALDSPDTKTVERLIEEFRSSGGGVVWISHDAAQRQRVSHRTLAIVGGSLREQTG